MEEVRSVRVLLGQRDVGGFARSGRSAADQPSWLGASGGQPLSDSVIECERSRRDGLAGVGGCGAKAWRVAARWWRQGAMSGSDAPAAAAFLHRVDGDRWHGSENWRPDPATLGSAGSDPRGYGSCSQGRSPRARSGMAAPDARDMGQWWHPTVAGYLGRVSKPLSSRPLPTAKAHRQQRISPHFQHLPKEGGTDTDRTKPRRMRPAAIAMLSKMACAQELPDQNVAHLAGS
jgi:hypothetical protein